MLVFPAFNALPDWQRKVYELDFGDSFAEWTPEPPASLPTIATATVQEMSSTLTVGTPVVGPTTVTVPLSGGSDGTYQLKGKVVLSTGVRLAFYATYNVVDYADAVDLETIDHLIDVYDDTTWERDLQFPFGDVFAEFALDPAPTIVTANFVNGTGGAVVNGTPVVSGNTVAVRVYCTTPGQYLVRCQATLSDTPDATVLSIPVVLNAYSSPW